jgi:hypothetical protein
MPCCFVVENLSFIEIRDCFIKSIMDQDPAELKIRDPNQDDEDGLREATP